jgi:hypothetical protein
MTTATGDYAFNFNGQANENPWVETGITVRSGGTTRIASNVLRPNTTTFFAYTGGTYDGGAITVAAEVNASAVDDEPVLGVLDGNGDGIMLMVRPTQVVVIVLDNYVVIDSAATASVTLTADDLFTFTVTKGSPNSFSATQNGTPITLSASTYAVTLATLEATWELKSENVGTAAIKSLAVVDGLSAGGGGGFQSAWARGANTLLKAA